MRFVGGPNTRTTNPRWRMAAVLKQETHQEMSWRNELFYYDIFNHFYAMRPGSYRIQ